MAHIALGLARWFTISPSGRVDVIICGRGGTRSRGPCQFSQIKILVLSFAMKSLFGFSKIFWFLMENRPGRPEIRG
ncbi:Os01g0864566 [Oryza sativa Japonica Group]|uniref:Os01g0864566 protein n=1 Tax=Oryza sativa subsp. japonica TaxID=39947 RepID=A0A0P0VAP4_ORYSJ|nr:hypothetical protein EE612_006997 [Oryza sativa]BAS75368.1 Os01g0864566 [Oryza sativa Japonica Group]